MLKKFVKLFAAPLAIVATGNAVSAGATLSCSDMNTISGTTTSSISFQIDMFPGETLTIHTTTPTNLGALVSYPASSPNNHTPAVSDPNPGDYDCSPVLNSCDGYQIQVEEPTRIVVKVLNWNNENTGPLSEIAPQSVDIADYSFSCTSGSNNSSTTAHIEGGAQGGAFNAGLGGQAGARNGGGNNVTQNSMFLSTANMGNDDSAWSVWMHGDLRRYEGDYEGNGTNLVIGADTEIGAGTYIGGLIGIGSLDLDHNPSVTNYSSDTISFGGYIIASLGGNLGLHGYVAMGRPDVDADGETFSADRRLAGLTIDGTYSSGSLSWTPFLSISGFEEDRPDYGLVAAHTVVSYTGSVGLRIDAEAQMGGSMAYPYVSIAGEFRHFDDGLGNVEEFEAMRLGAGVVVQSGDTTFSLDFDKGNVTENTEDFGISFNWRGQF